VVFVDGTMTPIRVRRLIAHRQSSTATVF